MTTLIPRVAPLLRASAGLLLLNLRPGILVVLSCALVASLLPSVQGCSGGSEVADQVLSPSPSPPASRSATASAAPPASTHASPLPEPRSEPTAITPIAATAEAATVPPAPAVSMLTVVDKQHALPAGYIPPDMVAVDGRLAAPGFGGLLLRAEANGALGTMLAAATADGHAIRVRSAYRSYSEQERTFVYWVSVLGEAEARRVSAEAGHSEHQLGTAVDMTSADVGYDLTEAFSDTDGGRWLTDNAHRYGFALSYPAGAEALTGYAYEPWHYRYVGAERAAAWQASGVTLGEYLRGLGG